MNIKKHCIFVTTSYPPFPESQTIRNVFLINGLVEAGFSLTVVTGAADTEGDEELGKLVHNSVKVVRTDSTLYHNLQARIATLSINPRFKRRLRSLTAVICGKVLAPDVWAGWQAQAVNLASKEAKCSSAPTVIISSSGSYTAHIAASRLAKILKVPWIAEYGDPWYLNPLGTKIPWVLIMNKNLEKRALLNCSGMTVTTAETARLYNEWLKKKTPKISIIPCGFYPLENLKNESSSIEAKFTIAYVGSASATNRDLGLFMQILDEALKRTNGPRNSVTLFRVIGSCSPLFERSAKMFTSFETEFSGWVTYTKSIEEMGAANALLLIGNKSRSQIPGKVYQYMAAGRPIIYLSQMRRDDPTERLLRQHPAVLLLKVSEQNNSKRLTEFLESHAKLRVIDFSKPMSDEFSESYNWKNIGRRFAEFVESRLNNR